VSPLEEPPEVLLAVFSKPSPPIRMSRPRPIMVLQELNNMAAAETVIKRVIFIEVFDTPIFRACKRIL
jgi:hypothetical protein